MALLKFRESFAIGIGILGAELTRRLQLPQRSKNLSRQTKRSVRSSRARFARPCPGLGKRRHSGKLHVDDFVPHRIQHQLDDRMKIELEHDIAAMGFCRFHFHVQEDGDFLGSLALTQELQNLALPRRTIWLPWPRRDQGDTAAGNRSLSARTLAS